MVSKMRLSMLCSVILSQVSAVGVGYNSECLLDSECKATMDSTEYCCAQLEYEANGVTIKKRECLTRTTMADAGGAYEFEGITTTNAYCD